MNIRKPVDYSEMYASLDMAVAGKYAQMQMYTMIGQAVTAREEKGAAVAAAEYLQMRHPDMSGFSPRNLRRMRDFYCTYAQDSALLNLAMQIGWTQNVVILEAGLTMQERSWYLKQVAIYDWTKKQLIKSIENSLHLVAPLDEADHLCYTVEEPNSMEKPNEESIICEPVDLAPGSVCAVSIHLFDRLVCMLHKIRSGIEKCRLRQLRPPDRAGTGRYPGSVHHLWRRLWGEDFSSIKIHRLPRGIDSMQKKKGKIESWQEHFDIIEELGEGGNGKVYRVCKRDTGDICALKRLENKSSEKKSRFLSEIHVVIQNATALSGVLPILEYSEDEFWYTMPVAEPIMNHLQEKNTAIQDVAQAVIQLSETLEQLHAKEITHRDIKPSNIYYFNGQYCLADFGLASHPENEDEFTRSDKGLGAIFTIAPEMKRNPKHADGKKADVFSLAKTIWMLLTRDERGFDGVYQFQDKSHSLRYRSQFRNIHLVELEDLLTAATQNDPDCRPTMEEFRTRFINWMRVSENHEDAQKSDWAFLKRYLFGMDAPETASWSNPERIINILNVVGSIPAYNHMMLPDGGGMDLKASEPATETGCIRLYDDLGCCYLVCPHRLHYATFEDDIVWSYFFLELKELPFVLGETCQRHEVLVEDTPGHYVSARYAQYGVYDYDTGEKLPDGFRVVYRYNSGNFLIVFKSGPYNGISATYDGRHSSVDFQGFSKYMEMLRQSYYHYLDQGFSHYQIVSSTKFGRNPFTKNNQKEQHVQNYVSSRPAREYIERAHSQWDFSGVLTRDKSTGNAAFYIELQINSHDIFQLLSQERTILCEDGHFRLVGKTEIESLAYLLYNREECSSLLDKCEQKLVALCNDQGITLPEYESFLRIVIQRLAIPEHLFTREEIKMLMRNADDRVSNTLVIDENGYANIISGTQPVFSYPVRLDSWDAGNCYVGKYSQLSMLDDVYLQALEGWLDYLTYGKSIYKDYAIRQRTAEELVIQIHALTEQPE